jgi:hypothetical protein
MMKKEISTAMAPAPSPPATAAPHPALRADLPRERER